MLSSNLLRPSLAILAAAALALAAACNTPPTASSADLASLAFDGSQAPVEALDREIAAAGHDRAELRALAQRLVTTLRSSDATFAARQAIAQRLGVLPADALLQDAAAATFTAMLADPAEFELARLALERVPGAAVDTVFLNALPNATGTARLAIVQSLGNRRVAAAVSPLTSLLRDDNPDLDLAAAKALGQIGTAEALAALSAAPGSAEPSLIEARLTAADRLGGARAASTYSEISDAAGAPPHLRAAALRSLLALEPSAAPARVTRALAGDDAVLKAAVIEAIADLPAHELVPALTGALDSFDAPTQVAVIAALARKGDARAVPALASTTRHSDPDVRDAAIAALGHLEGNPDIARLLAEIIATAGSDAARIARPSLARLNGPGVADTILTAARTAGAPQRTIYIEQLASRYMIDAIPALLQMRTDSDAAVRGAALSALGEIAPASQQIALLAWTLAATAPDEQARALRALASVSLRNPNVDDRARPIINAVADADAALALRLLPVLPRLGGAASADAVGALALRDHPALANAALSTLSRWSDHTALPPLLNVAEKAASETARAAAVQSAIRFLERYRALSPADLSSTLGRLLEVARDESARQRLVYLLGRGSDDAALALATKLQADPLLATEAAAARSVIAANRAGPPSLNASSGLNQLKNITDGKTNTQWSTAAEPGKWIEIDFKLTRPIRQVILDQSGIPENTPEQLELFVTDDLQNPGPARASATGTITKTVIDFPPGTQGRYLVMRHTGERVSGWWTISDLYVD